MVRGEHGAARRPVSCVPYLRNPLMKALAWIAVVGSLAFAAAPVCSAEPPASPRSSEVQETYPRAGRVQVWLNPISTFTTGPSVGLLVMLGDSIALGPLLRVRGLGLVSGFATRYMNYNSTDAEMQMLPYSTDLGLEVGWLISSPRRETMIRLGIEAGVGLAWTRILYQPSMQYWSYSSYDGFGMVLAQGAYRWRYPSGMFIECGGRLGVQMLLWQATWFLDSPETIYRSIAPEFYPTGSLDVTIGFEMVRG